MADDTFVIHQHHARRLHWDLRLERGGALASWAVPRGLPREPGRNHLAVQTPDHPLDFFTFHGEIPVGEYGAGRMTIYDTGTYTTEKWRPDEVLVAFQGNRTTGRYVLFRTGGKDWMVRRLDPAPAGWSAPPADLAPMLPTPARRLPRPDDAWAYELRWRGDRILAEVTGGRLPAEITTPYPQLRAMAEALAPLECVLDGVVVSFGRNDVQFFAVDLLWLDGVPTLALPYAERRELLDGLALTGDSWQTPPSFTGGGRYAREAAAAQGLPGIIAKRLDSAYEPGVTSRGWLSLQA